MNTLKLYTTSLPRRNNCIAIRSLPEANLRRTFRSPYSGNYAMWVEGESIEMVLSFLFFWLRRFHCHTQVHSGKPFHTAYLHGKYKLAKFLLPYTKDVTPDWIKKLKDK